MKRPKTLAEVQGGMTFGVGTVSPMSKIGSTFRLTEYCASVTLEK